MQYITIVEDSYEDAVRKARETYGENVRIQSRRDFTTHGGIFTKKQKKCEITCYIVDEPVEKPKEKAHAKEMNEFEKEAKTPDPKKLTKEEMFNSDIHRGTEDGAEEARTLLEKNHITGELKEKLLKDFSFNLSECARQLSERIIENIPLDYEAQVHPSRYMVFLGPTGTGKTTTLAKIAYLYKSAGKKVGIITLDTYRVGAFEQISAFGNAFDIPVEKARQEDELLLAMEKFTYYDLVLVDTMGVSNKDMELNLRLRSMGLLLAKKNTSFSLIVSASMKEEDMAIHYDRYRGDFKVQSLIVTKLDESKTIGNAISFAYKEKLPILFVTDGQKVPEDLEKASTEIILEHLVGFGLDMKGARQQLNY